MPTTLGIQSWRDVWGYATTQGTIPLIYATNYSRRSPHPNHSRLCLSSVFRTSGHLCTALVIVIFHHATWRYPTMSYGHAVSPPLITQRLPGKCASSPSDLNVSVSTCALFRMTVFCACALFRMTVFCSLRWNGSCIHLSGLDIRVLPVCWCSHGSCFSQ
jgi:hypothetical protein